MKKFEFSEFFYDAVKDLTTQQVGDFIVCLCEYYFSGWTNFDKVDPAVRVALNMAINYNQKQQQETNYDFDQIKKWSKEVLNWCKENDKIQTIKREIQLVNGFGGVQDEVEQEFPYIPKEQVEKILDWIKNKYDEKYYL